jgi:TonB family protein
VIDRCRSLACIIAAVIRRLKSGSLILLACAIAATAQVRVSSGVTESNLLEKVDPVYPPIAKTARIQGSVVLAVEIDKEGAVTSVQVVSGHPMLATAATDAVKQWRYRPYILNGEPVAVRTEVTVNFQLGAPDPNFPEGFSKTNVENGIRQFMSDVSQQVTARGPAAWKDFFENDPGFFMASDGAMVFHDADAAARGIEALTHTLKHIELHWGDDLRIDAITPSIAAVAVSWHEVQVDSDSHETREHGFFTGMAELKDNRWRFRSAHWSSAKPQAR